MNRNLWSLLIIAPCFLTACVSKSKHESTIGEKDTEIGQLSQQLKTVSSQNDEKAKAIQMLEDKLVNATKDKGHMKAAIEDMRRAMSEMQTRQIEEQKRIAEFRDLTQKFKSLTDSGTLKVKIIDGRMVVSLGSDVLFPSGSARLSLDGLKAIKEVGQKLNEISEKKFQIEGHTDNVPISSAAFPSNWELASARALTVVKAMIESGMQPQRISAASFGETKPVQANESPDGRRVNRRIEIVVVPDLSSLPGYEELNRLAL